MGCTYFIYHDIFTKYQPCNKHGEYSVLGNLDSHLQGPKCAKEVVSINNIFLGFSPSDYLFVNACPMMLLVAY